jgi:hypothetical protein
MLMCALYLLINTDLLAEEQPLSGPVSESAPLTDRTKIASVNAS